jgi:hypothetical protein
VEAAGPVWAQPGSLSLEGRCVSPDLRLVCLTAQHNHELLPSLYPHALCERPLSDCLSSVHRRSCSIAGTGANGGKTRRTPHVHVRAWGHRS